MPGFSPRARAMRAQLGRLSPALLLLLASTLSQASRIDVPGPLGSYGFGERVALLPNGNFVVVQRGPAADVGAVHLYSAEGELLSTLTGGTAEDVVGSGLDWELDTGGIEVLANGDFLVRSPFWDNPETGAVDAGAVTLVDGEVGLSGVVSASNSLVGGSASDRVGATVLTLPNGGYAVVSSWWDNGELEDAGAVTVVPPGATATGLINSANSLIGTNAYEYIGRDGAILLTNGNLVVCSSFWNDYVGAVTWVDTAVGISGTISAGNSLVGRVPGDSLYSSCATPLHNGNYVVVAPRWHDDDGAVVGAAIWADGLTGGVGQITAGNSLIGTRPGTGDDAKAYALANGHYVVTGLGPSAATWGDGYSGMTGQIAEGNSIVGGGTVGGGGIIALTNGNYVVLSPGWGLGGAATWADGSGPTALVISSSNSLIGTNSLNRVGSAGTALANGNYVVQSRHWGGDLSGGDLLRGAATWGSGTSGVVGIVSEANSLVGSQRFDQVGSLVVPLDDGNYVVASASWSNGEVAHVGAVTWGDGSTGIRGVVGPENSLIGASEDDGISVRGVLPDGGYVVSSPLWDGSSSNVGVIATMRGGAAAVGFLDADSTVTGSSEEDRLGSPFVDILVDGTLLVASSGFDYDGAGAGAVTFLPLGSRARQIRPENSIIGAVAWGGEHRPRPYDYDPDRRRLLVGRVAENRVTLVTVPPPTLFGDGFE